MGLQKLQECPVIHILKMFSEVSGQAKTVIWTDATWKGLCVWCYFLNNFTCKYGKDRLHKTEFDSITLGIFLALEKRNATIIITVCIMIICNRYCWCLWIAMKLPSAFRWGEKTMWYLCCFFKSNLPSCLFQTCIVQSHWGTGSMSRLCKRKKVFDWKIWQVVLAFWTQETTNFSLWQISVILTTVTKGIFTLHFFYQSMAFSLLRLHLVTGEKICVLSLSYLCKKYILPGTETVLCRLILTNTDWVLSIFSLVNGIDFSKFNVTPECFQEWCCFYVNLKCVYTILFLHSVLMNTYFHHGQHSLGHRSYM